MKLFKTLGFALIAGSCCVGTGHASTILRICGSTAYRAAVTQAIVNTLGAGYKCNYTSDSSAGFYGATAQIFEDSIEAANSGTGTIIETYWTGSASGDIDLAAQTLDPFPDPSNGFQTPTGSPAVVATPMTLTGTGSYTITGGGAGAAPNVAMSDCYAASAAIVASSATLSAPVGASTSASALATLIKTQGLTDAGTQIGGGSSGPGPVGIVAFEFLASNQTGIAAVAPGVTPTAPPFGDITAFTAENLIAGPTPVSMFDANTDGTNGAKDYVYLVGRNEDSGTRINTFAVSGVGLNPLTVSQQQLTFTSNQKKDVLGNPVGGIGATVFSAGPFTAGTALNTEPNMSWSAPGHSGYIAGGDVANVLSAYNPLNVVPSNAPAAATGNNYFVGYVGLADAVSASNCTILSYQGVTPSVAAIQSGQYPLFSLEHMYYLNGSHSSPKISGTTKTLADNIANNIFSTTASTDKYQNTTSTHTAAAQQAVVHSGVYDAAGVFLDTSVLYINNGNDGGTYISNTY